MITEKDLQEAIAECEGQRNPTANTCIKLAAFYTIKQHMFPDDVDVLSLPSHSYSGSQDLGFIEYDSGTEFSGLINGRKAEDVFPIIDDIMSTLSVVNPKLYAGAIRALS